MKIVKIQITKKKCNFIITPERIPIIINYEFERFAR